MKNRTISWIWIFCLIGALLTFRIHEFPIMLFVFIILLTVISIPLLFIPKNIRTKQISIILFSLIGLSLGGWIFSIQNHFFGYEKKHFTSIVGIAPDKSLKITKFVELLSMDYSAELEFSASCEYNLEIIKKYTSLNRRHPEATCNDIWTILKDHSFNNHCDLKTNKLELNEYCFERSKSGVSACFDKSMTKVKFSHWNW